LSKDLRSISLAFVPEYFVYLLASRSRVLYVGVTRDLAQRVWQHRSKEVPGFTSKYNVTRLVHFESFPTARQAIAREKQLKGWRRSKKIALIESGNPQWRDLAEGGRRPLDTLGVTG
jgi:putative endonuclease